MDSLIDNDAALFCTIQNVLQIVAMGQGIAPTSEGQWSTEASVIGGIAIGRAAAGGASAAEQQATGDESIDTAEVKELPDMFVSKYIFDIRPMKEPASNACMFEATSLGTEIVSRHLYATENGPSSEFPAGNVIPPMDLIEECRNENIWHPESGVFMNRIGQLLRKVKESGLLTENSDVRLWLKEWKMLRPKRENSSDKLTDADVKRLLRDKQCFMGILLATTAYDDTIPAPRHGGGNSFRNFFSGCPAEDDALVVEVNGKKVVQVKGQRAGYHAVTCYGYKDCQHELGGGLRILVLDNFNEKLPSKWVDFKAFDGIITLTPELPSRDPPPSANPAVHPEVTPAVVISPSTTTTTVASLPTGTKSKGLTPKKHK